MNSSTLSTLERLDQDMARANLGEHHPWRVLIAQQLGVVSEGAQQLDELFTGLEPHRVPFLLESIGRQAELIMQLAAAAGLRAENAAGQMEAAITFRALAALATQLGAMADAPIGGRVLGCLADWTEAAAAVNEMASCEERRP